MNVRLLAVTTAIIGASLFTGSYGLADNEPALSTEPFTSERITSFLATRAVGYIIRGISPSHMGIVGTAQMLDIHGPEMRSHWRAIREAIQNTDNIQAPTPPPKRFAFITRENDRRGLIKDLGQMEYLMSLLENEYDVERIRETAAAISTKQDKINALFVYYNQDPLFLDSLKESASNATCPATNPGTKSRITIPPVNNGTFVYCEYYSNGMLGYQLPYKDHKRNGNALSYFDTGQKKAEVAYENDRIHGPFIQWGIKNKVYFKWREGMNKNGHQVKGSVKRYPEPK